VLYLLDYSRRPASGTRLAHDRHPYPMYGVSMTAYVFEIMPGLIMCFCLAYRKQCLTTLSVLASVQLPLLASSTESRTSRFLLASASPISQSYNLPSLLLIHYFSLSTFNSLLGLHDHVTSFKVTEEQLSRHLTTR
jgi:hypothetical protein